MSTPREKLTYRSQFQPAPVASYTSTYHYAPKRFPSPANARRFTPRRSFSILRVVTAIALVYTVWHVPTLFRGWRKVEDPVFVVDEPVLEGIRGGERVKLLPRGYELPSGDVIPSVALGTWLAEPGEVGEAVKAALKAGYRHIDGAWAYKNEAEIGQAIKDSGIQRKDLWLTSKLWNTFHDPADIEGVLDQTLANLQTSYLDLYLIHWPVAFAKEQGPNGEVILDHDLTENPLPTWKKLEELHFKGKIRNIGVSNFNVRRLKNLTDSDELVVRPAVNQVELSYFNPQPELVKWSKEKGILLEAYSPLGSAKQVKESLDVPEVKEIADILQITPAQVLLSWQLQRGNVILPKSVHPSRIVENLHVTRLPQSLFDKLEAAAAAHPPQRAVDPSKQWGLDIFEDDNPITGTGSSDEFKP